MGFDTLWRDTRALEKLIARGTEGRTRYLQLLHHSIQLNDIFVKKKKTHFFLSVNVFSTKVLIGDTIFTSPTGDGTAIST